MDSTCTTLIYILNKNNEIYNFFKATNKIGIKVSLFANDSFLYIEGSNDAPQKTHGSDNKTLGYKRKSEKLIAFLCTKI